MAFDYKKEYKEFYLPKAQPQLVTVPPMNYIAVRGQGDPNEEGGAYKAAIGLLYGVAFTIKMSKHGASTGILIMWCRRWRASGGSRARWALIMPISSALSGYR